mmetsp:Transcript_66987/g.146850  ORF Transcript_66987/g.146850 Transcript_66987/m.146850 type:complete len:104 (-) Transcript_66987:1493-1804(-)
MLADFGRSSVILKLSQVPTDGFKANGVFGLLEASGADEASAAGVAAGLTSLGVSHVPTDGRSANFGFTSGSFAAAFGAGFGWLGNLEYSFCIASDPRLRTFSE